MSETNPLHLPASEGTESLDERLQALEARTLTREQVLEIVLSVIDEEFDVRRAS